MQTPGFSGRLLAQSFLSSLETRVDGAVLAGQRSWAKSYDRAGEQLGPASAPRAIFETTVAPLLTSLGFIRIENLECSATAVAATAHSDAGAAAVVVTHWAARLDAVWRIGMQAAARRGTAWCLLFNGPEMRVVDAGRLYSRRFAAFDLALAREVPATADVLWKVASAQALCAGASDPSSLHALVAASNRFGAGVCRSLRDGVLCASTDVLSALISRHPDAAAQPDLAFEQALTVVYRMLFLLFAEARSLVPMWHPVYRDSYSIDALREAAERSEPAPGMWDTLRAIARLAHAGCRAGDLLVNPFNGRLFSPARTPLAERRNLDDDAARRAVLAISTRSTDDRIGRERIVYRDLGVEELGAVYETLLDYRPRVEQAPARRRARPAPVVTLEAGSGVRKATGTFYTPQPIAEYLVRRTLGPLVAGASAADVLGLRVLDMAMGSGAFLVAACRFLADAYERAQIESGELHETDVDDRDRAAFRRLVAERCLYGVDVNPMAVQLARLSLWLTTLAADRPLSFLDHRLVAGDSLLGAWLASLRTAPIARRRTRAELPLFADEIAAGALDTALPARFALESMPGDTIADVRAKERTYSGLSADSRLRLWKRVADLWCSTWFTPADRKIPPTAFRALADEVLTGQRTLSASSAAAHLARSDDLAGRHRLFHWELEFPEVFFERDGRRRSRPGFDAVIGNPPWDMIRADDGEPEGRADTRALAASTIRFTRDSGVYAAQSAGHANRYQLFVERTLALTRSGGRYGLVLPSGFASDHGSAALRRLLFSRSEVDGIVGLDNNRRIFPIHRSVRFLLLSATAGRPTVVVPLRLGIDSASALDTVGDDDQRSGFPIRLSMDGINRLSGPDLAIPHVRTAIDLGILEKAASLFPPLGDERGWHLRFGRELNATDDRRAFHSGPHGIPVLDGRHITPFMVNAAAASRRIRHGELARRLDASRIARPRLAYRDVAGATNRVTLIAGVLPAGCVSTHTVFCLRSRVRLADQHLLCGFFNSLVVNYLVRCRVTTHVTTAIVERLPIPTRAAGPAVCRTVAALARRLSKNHRAADWVWLNVLVAGLYQLQVEELTHVLETFPLVPRQDRDAIVSAFRDG